ncbi:HIT family protein [Tautonia sociabilis]|uniref:HIT family protein n=1 Tax=Tautonia sociabilis TaxID=2080755 RepID=A0A432MG89_9BACT|nr:HIT family protein [Tautonia sociabilis]RUL85390.1 HIT family protein [Tautonia sociabilis]
MAYDPQNVFAKILRGEIPSAKVLETDGALAFLDIGPVNKGHVLVIPKVEAATLSELPDDASAHVGALLPRLCRAVREATGAEGLNVIVNHGEVAGQTVHHVHWHIIPRFRGDAVRWPWPHDSYDGDELERMRLRIAAALGPASSSS